MKPLLALLAVTALAFVAAGARAKPDVWVRVTYVSAGSGNESHYLGIIDRRELDALHEASPGPAFVHLRDVGWWRMNDRDEIESVAWYRDDKDTGELWLNRERIVKVSLQRGHPDEMLGGDGR